MLLRESTPVDSLQSLRSTLCPRRTKRTSDRLLEPVLLSSGKGFASPRTPLPIVRSPLGSFLHWGLSVA